MLQVNDMAFKDTLRRLREAAGLTQQQLAVAAGVTTSAVTQMEAGKIQNPRLDTVKALARALGVGLMDLVGDDVDEASPAQKKKGKGK